MIKENTTFDIGTLYYAKEAGITKPIALFYKVKAMYFHSIIFGYTPRKLAKNIKLNPKTVERYVKKLQDHGFVEFRDGNLLFKNIRKALPHKDYRKSKLNLVTRPYNSFQSILDRIYYVLIINNKKQQEFKIATHYGKDIEKLNPTCRKKALKNADLTDRGLESSDKAILSISGASKLLNLSQKTSAKILTRLKNKNYLELTPVINKLSLAFYHLRYASGLGYFFNQGGILYQYLGREIKIGSYWSI